MLGGNAMIRQSKEGRGLMKRDISMSLPNFRPTATKQRQKKIMIERRKRICLPTDRYRGGVVMQTRTGGRLSTPVQQRTRREKVAQYGNTRMIPTQILDPGDELSVDEKMDPASGLMQARLKVGGRVYATMLQQLNTKYQNLVKQGQGNTPAAQQLKTQIQAVQQKQQSVQSVVNKSPEELTGAGSSSSSAAVNDFLPQSGKIDEDEFDDIDDIDDFDEPELTLADMWDVMKSQAEEREKKLLEKEKQRPAIDRPTVASKAKESPKKQGPTPQKPKRGRGRPPKGKEKE